MAGSGTGTERPWKAIIAAALVGTASFAAGLFVNHHGDAAEHTAVSVPAKPDMQATAEPLAPEPDGTEYAPEEALAAAREAADAARGAGAGADAGPRHVFAESAMDPQEGNFKDRFGDCYGAYGKSPSEIASYIEARLGKRITGFDWFDDGIVVNFRSGERLPVWQKEIDCKDPPYDPLRGKHS